MRVLKQFNVRSFNMYETARLHAYMHAVKNLYRIIVMCIHILHRVRGSIHA